jgi:hypothetical protein
MEGSDQLHASAAIPPAKELPAPTEWATHWVSSRADLNAVAKRKNSIIAPCRELNPGLPARSLVTIVTELPRLLFHFNPVVQIAISQLHTLTEKSRSPLEKKL